MAERANTARHESGLDRRLWGGGMLANLFGKTRQNESEAPDGMRIYAVGDIHGRADLLNDLLNLVADDMNDADELVVRLVFLGDYVDRGFHSKEVIERLVELKNQTSGLHFLKGNHEQAMAQFLNDASVGHVWLEYGGLETLHSYGVHCVRSSSDTGAFEQAREELNEKLPESHRQFLSELEISVEYGDYFFVHAGVRPGVALADQDEEDLLWIRDDFIRSNAKHEKVIVYGHTPSESPVDKAARIGVDTGAYMTGRLTAVALQDRDRYFISTD